MPRLVEDPFDLRLEGDQLLLRQFGVDDELLSGATPRIVSPLCARVILTRSQRIPLETRGVA